MKTFVYFLFLFLFTSPAISQVTPPAEINGKWTGAITVQNSKLRIVFNFKNQQKSISVTLDSPDQGAKGIPANDLIFRNDTIIVDVPAIVGRYKAVLTSATTMRGTWYQGGTNFPLDITKSSEMAVIPFPQTNALYDSKEVKIVNEKAGVTLAGTLTIPKQAKNCPAVVLVSGSGPQNRDEELMGQKPFFRIADYLSSHGIAVLRYDDRGVNESTGNFQTATSFDFADDAEMVFAFLKKQAGINSEKVGIAGHSEGAMIAPIVASRNEDVAFIVLLAGPGITGKEILITQNEALLSAQGLSKDSIMKMVNFNKEIIQAVESNPKNEDAQNLIKQAIAKLNLPKPIQETYIKSYSVYLSPWFRTFISFNPAPYLSRVKCSVLVLNGSKDLQVLPKENLTAIEKALRNAKNTKYEIRALEGFNHLFQQSETGLPTEYWNTDKPAMDNKVLEITEEWIKKISF